MLHIWIVTSFHFIAVLSYNYIKDVYGETYWVTITRNIETMTGERMNFWIMYFVFRITGIIVIGSCIISLHLSCISFSFQHWGVLLEHRCLNSANSWHARLATGSSLVKQLTMNYGKRKLPPATYQSRLAIAPTHHRITAIICWHEVAHFLQ